MKVLVEIVAQRTLESGSFLRKGHFEFRYQERDDLPLMAKNQLELWKAVESAAQDHPQRMRTGLEVPAPGRGGQPEGDLRGEVAGVGGGHHRVRRKGRVQIERNRELFGALEQRPGRLVVQVSAPRVAVDHRPFEIECADRSLQ